MGRTRNARGLVDRSRRERGVFSGRVRLEQRIHFSALLIAICLAATPVFAGDIAFDPATTEQEFRDFSERLGQAIFPSPVDGAAGTGLLGFDIGIAVNAVPIDETASYWQRAVDEDFSRSGYLLVPRVIISKGLGAVRLSTSYAKVPDSDIQVRGGSLDVPLLRGGLIRPSLSLRGSYAQLSGVDEYRLKTYGAELFLSKRFGPITPYGGVGMTRTSARGSTSSMFAPPLARTFEDETDGRRYTIGAKLSIPGPKIVVEATQGKERSYAARVSLGL